MNGLRTPSHSRKQDHDKVVHPVRLCDIRRNSLTSHEVNLVFMHIDVAAAKIILFKYQQGCLAALKSGTQASLSNTVTHRIDL